MKIACPSCGADVEFRYDDSLVRVCSYCRAAVARKDRRVESLGKLADLVPIDSPLRLNATGTWNGVRFTLVGKSQLRHERGGLWQEWYALFSDGRWGWVAEHQGRVSIAFEDTSKPQHFTFSTFKPGSSIHVLGYTFTIAETGVARAAAATGELPFRVEPGTPFAYADLSDGKGRFATLDFGEAMDEASTPAVYLGHYTTFEALQLKGGDPPDDEALRGARSLGCPSCGGNIPLRVPDQTLRVVCPSCRMQLSCEEGDLRVLGALAHKPTLDLPLGTQVQLDSGQYVVVGYMKRAAFIDSQWYPFDEYLLHSRTIGFRWLVSSDGHWSFVEPVDPGAVQESPASAAYRGVVFKQFLKCTLRVDQVWGEMYWRVQTGDVTQTRDLVAPPAMLSREDEYQEVHFSLSSYLTLDEVRKATGVDVPDRRVGVAPNQPERFVELGKRMRQLFGMLLVLALVGAFTSKATRVQEFNVEVPSGKPQSDPGVGGASDSATGHVVFSEPFELRAGKNVDVTLSAPLSNNWAYVSVDLFNEETGTFVTVDKDLEYYSGVSGGESWSEGSPRKSSTLAPLPPGRYLARIEALHGSMTSLTINVLIRQGVYRFVYVFVAALLLGALALVAQIFRRKLEEQRWENSGTYGPPRKAK